MPLLPAVLLLAALAGCSDDEPSTSDSPTAVEASDAPTPTEASSPDDETPELTTFGESDAASIAGCLTRSKDGYSYAFSLDVDSGEVRYRIRMPHMDEWADWSMWLGPLSFSTKSGASFGEDPQSLQGKVRAQLEVKDGERASFTSPLADLVACPVA